MDVLSNLRTERDKLVSKVDMLVTEYDKTPSDSEETTYYLVEIINHRNQVYDIHDKIINIIKQDLPKFRK